MIDGRQRWALSPLGWALRHPGGWWASGWIPTSGPTSCIWRSPPTAARCSRAPTGAGRAKPTILPAPLGGIWTSSSIIATSRPRCHVPNTLHSAPRDDQRIPLPIGPADANAAVSHQCIVDDPRCQRRGRRAHAASPRAVGPSEALPRWCREHSGRRPGISRVRGTFMLQSCCTESPQEDGSRCKSIGWNRTKGTVINHVLEKKEPANSLS